MCHNSHGLGNILMVFDGLANQVHAVLLRARATPGLLKLVVWLRGLPSLLLTIFFFLLTHRYMLISGGHLRTRTAILFSTLCKLIKAAHISPEILVELTENYGIFGQMDD